MTSWIARIIKGMIIALGFILPGVSGGVLAAILGIYERIIRFLAHIRENFMENVLFFIPVGIGGILGIALFSFPVEFLLQHYQVPVLWGFAGAIIGTIPSLVKESTRKSSRNAIDLAWLFGTFIVSGLLLYFLNQLVGTIPAGFAGFVLAGALIALGILVPGLSPSNLLLILGLYSPMLTGFKNLDLMGTFLPIAIGGLIAMLSFSKAMDYALEHYHSRVYHFIIGIVLSSTILILLPNASSEEAISYAGAGIFTWISSLLLFFLGIWLGLWMSKLEEKYK
jgi:putative membrane protein